MLLFVLFLIVLHRSCYSMIINRVLASFLYNMHVLFFSPSGVNRKLSLRGNRGDARVDLSQGEAGLREVSHAATWLSAMGDSGRAVTRDERVAMALAQSHENLAAAAVKFEESQERNSRLLGGLRGWFDGFTGTARPEDINPIAAMLPEPGLENEVAALMTDCQVCFSCL